MRDNLLTILLPLKGRHLHTLRFLWHANEVRLPHHIIIADGDVHPRIAELLEDPTTFPNLSLEYIRYPYDATFGHFFRKMADAAQRVRTPYVKLVDNDDFVGPGGLVQCVDFLERNADYVCCGGGIAGFALDEMSRTAMPNLVGLINLWNYRYTTYYRLRDLAADSMSERVFDAYRNYRPTYYDVFRTEAQRTIWAESAEIDFSDAQIFEYFCAMRTVTMGKARACASNIFYLRQYRTSGQGAFKKDWVDHLVHHRFTIDLDVVVERISHLIADADGCDRFPVEEELRDITAQWLRTFIKQSYGLNLMTIKDRFRGSMPNWFMKMRRLRPVAAARERRSLFDKLLADGASESYLEAFRNELDTIEKLLRQESFALFLQQRVAGLFHEARR
jgi:glycosyltransferase domain-containing protein